MTGKVFHPESGLGPHKADGARQSAAHVVGLRIEDVLNPDPHGGFCAVGSAGLVAHRLAPFSFAVDVACEFEGTQLDPP